MARRPASSPGPADAATGPRRLPRRSRRDRAQLHGDRARTAGCCSSTAGSCSPTPTCTASTSSCPTSPTCARTPTASRRASPPTATRTTSAACRTCCASCTFPIYGSALTLGLARNRIEEAGLLGRTELDRRSPTASGAQIGPFDVEFIPVTHSVPHALAVAVHTPQGVILHSGDFKLDLTPVDGRLTDLARIGAIASQRGHPAADGRLDQRRGAGPRAERARRRRACCRPSSPQQAGRRIITASFASHIHRIQQIADAAIAHGRVVATLGLSMRKNVAPRPRPRDPAASPTRRSSTSRTSTDLPPGEGLHHLDRARRASRCRRCRCWPRARTAG